MAVEWAVLLTPVIQGILANAAWDVTRKAGRALDGHRMVDFNDRMGIFSVQTLSVGAITDVLRDEVDLSALDPLPNGASSESVRGFLGISEVEVLVHELLITLLLEQSIEDVDLIRMNLNLLVELKFGIGQEDASRIGKALFDAIVVVMNHFIALIDTADVDTRSSIQQLAGLSSISSTVKSIERHLAAAEASRSSDRASWGAFESAYLDFVRRHHGVLVVSDSDVERRVPVEDLYVEAELTLPNGRRASLPRDLKAHPRIVVKGSPGGGKSTLAGVLMHRVAATDRDVPMLVTLREYGTEYEAGALIVEHLQRVLGLRAQKAVPEAWLEAVLYSGRAVVVFDGLDELLDPARRRDIRDAVEAFGAQYPSVRVLVTSRVVGYEQAPLSGSEYTMISLGEFSHRGVEEYTKAWFAIALTSIDAETRKQRLDAFMRESASVHEIRKNPLMLTLMCVLYRGDNYIPESRLALYEECAKLLFKKWDRSRGITIRLEIGPDIDAALMHLALWMLTSGHAASGVTESLVVESCVEYLVPRRFEHADDARRVAEEFVSYCRGRAWVLADAGLNEYDEPLYTFTHRTFLEYFAASQLTRINGTPEAVASAITPFLALEQFEVVAQLCIQIVNRGHDSGADRMLGALLADLPNLDEAGQLYVLSFTARVLRVHISAPALLRLAADRIVDFSLGMSDGLADELSNQAHFRDTWAGKPFGVLLACHEANREAIAGRIKLALEPFLVEFPKPKSKIHDRALVMVGFSRVVMSTRNGKELEAYRYWEEWGTEALKKIPRPVHLGFEAHDEMVPIVALENGLITLDAFVEAGAIASLWHMPETALRVFRVATLSLLAGWIIGDFWRTVFNEGTPQQLLRELHTLVERDIFPLPSRAPEPFDGGVNETRFSELDEEALGGVVVLFCMIFEGAGEGDLLAGQVPHEGREKSESDEVLDESEVSSEPFKVVGDLIIRHTLDTLEAEANSDFADEFPFGETQYLRSIGPDSLPVERLILEIFERRATGATGGSAVDVGGVLRGESKLALLVEDWANNQFSFLSIEDDREQVKLI